MEIFSILLLPIFHEELVNEDGHIVDGAYDQQNADDDRHRQPNRQFVLVVKTGLLVTEIDRLDDDADEHVAGEADVVHGFQVGSPDDSVSSEQKKNCDGHQG